MYLCTTVLAVGLLFPTAVRADYVTQTFDLDTPIVHAAGPTFGTVQVEAYNGVGAAGGGLLAGQVRITYTANSAPFYSASWAAANTSAPQHAAIEEVGFNTNLSLTSSQVQGPAGWVSFPNTPVDANGPGIGAGFGPFSWMVKSPTDPLNPPSVSILISGLGSNALVGNFLLGNVSLAAEVDNMINLHGVQTEITGGDLVGTGNLGPGSVASVPEPSALLLGFLGFGSAFLARKKLRTSRGKVAQAIPAL
jgi:hypothetical protein